MTMSMMKRLLAATLVVMVGLSATACGDDEDSEGDDEVITTIADASEGAGAVELEGFIVEQAGVAKLCEALLESFPPQCGEPSVTIANVDDLDVDFSTEQDVRWTDLPVRLVGSVDDGAVTVSP